MTDHIINDVGTVYCPVEYVRAFVDDDDRSCSACGATCEWGADD